MQQQESHSPGCSRENMRMNCSFREGHDTSEGAAAGEVLDGGGGGAARSLMIYFILRLFFFLGTSQRKNK